MRPLRLVPLLIGIAMALFVLLCAAGPFIAHYRLELKHYSADAAVGPAAPRLGGLGDGTT